MPDLALTKILEIISSVEAVAQSDPDPDVQTEADQVRRILRAAERGTVVDQAIGIFEDTGRSKAIRLKALGLLKLIALAETA